MAAEIACADAELIETQGLLDLVEEIRLRTWARLNYTAPEQRDDTWHPVVLEEMKRRDREATAI